MKTEINTPSAETFGAETHSLQIKQDHKAFRAFSDGLYSNKPEAIVRELSSNAIDAHQKAGTQDTPFDVFLPCEQNPRFIIRDYGTGLSYEGVKDILVVYGESDKDQSNDYIGGFGLGSKTPFAYSDQYFVRSYYDGYLYTYTFFFSKDCPNWSLISKEETDQPNGLEVYFDVDDVDFDIFASAAKKILPWFDRPVNVFTMSVEENGFFKRGADSENLTSQYVDEFKRAKVYEDDNLLISSYSSQGAGSRMFGVLQGGVKYGFGGSGLSEIYDPNHKTHAIAAALKTLGHSEIGDWIRNLHRAGQTGACSILFKMDIGTLELARSREVISWTRKHSVPNAKKFIENNLIIPSIHALIECLSNTRSNLHRAHTLARINSSRYTVRELQRKIENKEDVDLNESFKEFIYPYLGNQFLAAACQYYKQECRGRQQTTDPSPAELASGFASFVRSILPKLDDASIKAFKEYYQDDLINSNATMGYNIKEVTSQKLNEHAGIVIPEKGKFPDTRVTKVRYYSTVRSSTGNLFNRKMDPRIVAGNQETLYSIPVYQNPKIVLVFHTKRVFNLSLFSEYMKMKNSDISIHVDCSSKSDQTIIKKKFVPYMLKSMGAVEKDVTILFSSDVATDDVKKLPSFNGEQVTGFQKCLHTRSRVWEDYTDSQIDDNSASRENILLNRVLRMCDGRRRALGIISGEGLDPIRTQRRLDGLKDLDIWYAFKDHEYCKIKITGKDRSMGRDQLVNKVNKLIMLNSKSLCDFNKTMAKTHIVVISKADYNKVNKITKSMRPVEELIVQEYDKLMKNGIVNWYVQANIKFERIAKSIQAQMHRMIETDSAAQADHTDSDALLALEKYYDMNLRLSNRNINAAANGINQIIALFNKHPSMAVPLFSNYRAKIARRKGYPTEKSHRVFQINFGVDTASYRHNMFTFMLGRPAGEDVHYENGRGMHHQLGHAESTDINTFSEWVENRTITAMKTIDAAVKFGKSVKCQEDKDGMNIIRSDFMHNKEAQDLVGRVPDHPMAYRVDQILDTAYEERTKNDRKVLAVLERHPLVLSINGGVLSQHLTVFPNNSCTADDYMLSLIKYEDSVAKPLPDDLINPAESDEVETDDASTKTYDLQGS